MYGDYGRPPRGGGGPHRGMGRRPTGNSRIKLIQPALMVLLENGPLHGYALMDKLVDSFSISVMNPNQVYRALRALEGMGAISSDWDEDESQGPPRRVYQLTEDGKELLDFQIKDLEETRSVLNRVLEEHNKAA
jgi:PadR family transcriptional regulator